MGELANGYLPLTIHLPYGQQPPLQIVLTEAEAVDLACRIFDHCRISL